MIAAHPLKRLRFVRGADNDQQCRGGERGQADRR
jgi:hypothetical protein